MKFNKIALFVTGGSLVMASHAFGGTALPADAKEDVDASVIEMLYHKIESSTITPITVDYTADLVDATHTVNFCSVSSDFNFQNDPVTENGSIDTDGLLWTYDGGVYTSTATLIQPQDSAPTPTSLDYTMIDSTTVDNSGTCTGQPNSATVGKEALSELL